MDHLCHFCLVLLCFHVRLLAVALWSPAGKGLTSWLSFVMFNCESGVVLDCIMYHLIPDLCHLFYLNNDNYKTKEPIPATEPPPLKYNVKYYQVTS